MAFNFLVYVGCYDAVSDESKRNLQGKLVQFFDLSGMRYAQPSTVTKEFSLYTFGRNSSSYILSKKLVNHVSSGLLDIAMGLNVTLDVSMYYTDSSGEQEQLYELYLGADMKDQNAARQLLKIGLQVHALISMDQDNVSNSIEHLRMNPASRSALRQKLDYLVQIYKDSKPKGGE